MSTGHGRLTIVQFQRTDSGAGHERMAGRGGRSSRVREAQGGETGTVGRGSVQALEGRVVARLGEELEPDAGRALPLGPSVLVPRLHLRVREIELGRQLLAVLHTQILLFLKTSLQRLELVVREGCPGLPLLSHRVALAAAGVAERATRFVACKVRIQLDSECLKGDQRGLLNGREKLTFFVFTKVVAVITADILHVIFVMMVMMKIR